MAKGFMALLGAILIAVPVGAAIAEDSPPDTARAVTKYGYTVYMTGSPPVYTLEPITERQAELLNARAAAQAEIGERPDPVNRETVERCRQAAEKAAADLGCAATLIADDNGDLVIDDER